MTTMEDRLRQSLRTRADRTTYEPTPVLDVARRARELRRKRRTTSLLSAAAAVLALGVPTGVVLALDDGPGRTPAPAGPAEGPTVRIGRLSTLPAGARPAVDYVIGEVYVFAAGGRTELDVGPGGVRDAAPFPSGVVVTTNTNAVGIADHLYFGRDGELDYSGCGGEEFALSSDGRLAAYVNPGRGCDSWRRPLLTWGPTADQEVSGSLTETEVGTADGQRVEPVGVTADRTLYDVSDPASGEPAGVYVTGESGPPVEVTGIVRATTWDPITERVAGCTADDRCVVVDERDGSVLLALDAGEEALSFSPDGRHLATVTGAGAPSATVRVRDSRTGELVVTLAGDDAAAQGDPAAVAWEDSSHLLLSRVDPDGEALVRLGIDGTLSLATSLHKPTLGGYLLPGA